MSNINASICHKGTDVGCFERHWSLSKLVNHSRKTSTNIVLLNIFLHAILDDEGRSLICFKIPFKHCLKSLLFPSLCKFQQRLAGCITVWRYSLKYLPTSFYKTCWKLFCPFGWAYNTHQKLSLKKVFRTSLIIYFGSHISYFRS